MLEDILVTEIEKPGGEFVNEEIDVKSAIVGKGMITIFKILVCHIYLNTQNGLHGLSGRNVALLVEMEQELETDFAWIKRE